MSVGSGRGKTTRASSRGRSSSIGSRSAKSSPGAPVRAKGSSSRASRSAPNRTQSSSQRSRGSAQQNHAGREILTNAGISVLTAAVGVATGVLVGRTTARRDHKVLGVRVPTEIDLGGIGQQIGEAGRQFGKLASEVRTVREKAEQIGRVLT